jgi:dethiobiotin synthetase
MTTLFVVGTDTGVGKTVVAAAIVRAWRARGIDAVGMKPFATGCRLEAGALRSSDADALVAAGGSAAHDDLCPCRWAPPVAPLAAGATADDVARAGAAFRRLAAVHEAVVVEGIGGVLTPIAPGVDLADVVAAWGLPAVVVGRLGLGTINHTRLSVEALDRRGVEVAGIVLSEAVPAAGDPSAESNAAILADLTGLPILGVVPHGAAERAEDRLRVEPRRTAAAS